MLRNTHNLFVIQFLGFYFLCKLSNFHAKLLCFVTFSASIVIFTVERELTVFACLAYTITLSCLVIVRYGTEAYYNFYDWQSRTIVFNYHTKHFYRRYYLIFITCRLYNRLYKRGKRKTTFYSRKLQIIINNMKLYLFQIRKEPTLIFQLNLFYNYKNIGFSVFLFFFTFLQ